MLHKRHNAVVTLAILLTWVGVSKPAKALLLAQSNPATAFTAPDKLAKATINIAETSSAKGIGTSLKQSFGRKYPQAKVKIKTQDSVSALKSVAEGKADLAAIGRVLTPAEKAQGFVSVPISREKIALVVSKNNPFDGNLTIDQFAKIFRGEITDWSEIGRTPGKIQLIDAPNINDTRQAFPNYPVFQSAEFKTGSTANQLKQDSTEAMIAKLGSNGIGYAVANDVIKRNDVKVITMHQTQPDDPRYPFSEPFNLIYKGTPSKAAQAYLGFATAEGGKQVIANRVGSISAAAVTATAPGAKTATADKSPKAIANNATDKPIVANADVNPNVQSSANINPNVNDSGEVNPEIQSSGEVNPNVNDSGEVNPEIQSSGEVNPNVNGSGEVNPEIQSSGEPLFAKTSSPNNKAVATNATAEANPGAKAPVNAESQAVATNATAEADPDAKALVNAESQAVAPNATAEANPDAKAETRKGNWWWWLIPLLGIPLLAAAILGGRKRSDREPALNDIPNINSLDGRVNSPDSPGGESVPLGANRGGGVGNAETANNASNIGMAGLAAGGAALAGGAAADLARRRNRTESVADDDLNLDLDEPTTVEEIPSNPVSEFTGQETQLQVGDRATNLQIDEDNSEDLRLVDDIPASAALGGAAVSQFAPNAENETAIAPVTESPDLADIESDTRNAELTTEQTTDLTDLNLGDVGEADAVTTGREFPGDFVLQEEARNISAPDEVATDIDADLDRNTDVNLGDREAWAEPNRLNDTSVDFPSTVNEVATPDLDLSTDIDPNTDDRTDIIDGVIQAGGAAAIGGAASGIFNREDRTIEDTETDTANFNQDSDLNLGDRIDDVEVDSSSSYTETRDFSTFDLDLSTDVDPNLDRDNIDSATQAGSAAALGGAASEMFNRVDRDSQPISDIQEFETFETSFDFSEDTTSTNFADNVIADAETTSLDEVDSLEGVTLDDLANQDDLNLDDITIDNADSNIDASLEEIAFDDADTTEELNLDDVTIDNADSNIDASLEEITFDDADADNLSLDDITFEDTQVSNRSFVSDATPNTSIEEISLDDLGFEDANQTNTVSDLLSDNRAEITSLSDDRSDDMDNISQWLDSLQTPNQDSDNISQWLDTLEKDSLRAEPNSEGDNLDLETNTAEESDDVSFQFLEDLLDRDSDPNRNNQ